MPTPPEAAAFVKSGNEWVPATTTATAGALTHSPPPVGIFCWNSAINEWVPANPVDPASVGGDYLPLTGGAVSGDIYLSSDNTGIKFYGDGAIYKRKEKGMILQKSSGGQQWQIENHDGTGGTDIVTIASGDARYAFKADIPEIPPPATIGDVKNGFQPYDHAGWTKLDGRAINTLSVAQQSAASGLGFTDTLPDATDAVARQGAGVLGAVSGSMTRTLTQSHLPAVDLTSNSAGDHQHGMQACTNDEGTVGLSEMFAEYPQKIWRRPSTVANVNNNNLIMIGYPMEFGGTHTHTVPLGGSSELLDITPKSMSVNVFVYLGQ